MKYFGILLWNQDAVRPQSYFIKSIYEVTFKRPRTLVSQKNSKIFHRSVSWPSYYIVLNDQVILKKCGMSTMYVVLIFESFLKHFQSWFSMLFREKNGLDINFISFGQENAFLMIISLYSSTFMYTPFITHPPIKCICFRTLVLTPIFF